MRSRRASGASGLWAALSRRPRPRVGGEVLRGRVECHMRYCPDHVDVANDQQGGSDRLDQRKWSLSSNDSWHLPLHCSFSSRHCVLRTPGGDAGRSGSFLHEFVEWVHHRDTRHSCGFNNYLLVFVVYASVPEPLSSSHLDYILSCETQFFVAKIQQPGCGGGRSRVRSTA